MPSQELIKIILALSILLVGGLLGASAMGIVNVDQLTNMFNLGGQKAQTFNEQQLSLMKLYFENFIDAARRCQNLPYTYSCKCEAVEPPANRGSQALFFWDDTEQLTMAYLIPVTVDLSVTPLQDVPSEDIIQKDTLGVRLSPAIERFRSDVWYPLERAYTLFADHSMIVTKHSTPANYPYVINGRKATFAERTAKIKKWTEELWVLPHFSNTMEDIYTNVESLEYWERAPKTTVQLVHLFTNGAPSLVVAETMGFGISSTRTYDPFLDRMPSCQEASDARSEFQNLLDALSSAAGGVVISETRVRSLPRAAFITMNNSFDELGNRVLVVQGINFPEQMENGIYGEPTPEYTYAIPGVQVRLTGSPEERYSESCEAHAALYKENAMFECLGPACQCVYTGIIPTLSIEYVRNPLLTLENSREGGFVIGYKDYLFEIFGETGADLAIVDDSSWDTGNEYIILELV